MSRLPSLQIKTFYLSAVFFPMRRAWIWIFSLSLRERYQSRMFEFMFSFVRGDAICEYIRTSEHFATVGPDRKPPPNAANGRFFKGMGSFVWLVFPELGQLKHAEKIIESIPNTHVWPHDVFRINCQTDRCHCLWMRVSTVKLNKFVSQSGKLLLLLCAVAELAFGLDTPPPRHPVRKICGLRYYQPR